MTATSNRTILHIMPAPDMHVVWLDEDTADPDAWGSSPLIGWALVDGPLINNRWKEGRYVVGLMAYDEVWFADCFGPDIRYVSTSELPAARERAEKRAVKRAERERGRTA